MPALAEKIELASLQHAAIEACSLLKVLANPQRLLLLCQLSEGECCVSELEALSAIRQPTLSQQLTVLREEGLVDTRREGKQIYYSITSTQALAVMHVLHAQYCNKRKGRKK